LSDSIITRGPNTSLQSWPTATGGIKAIKNVGLFDILRFSLQVKGVRMLIATKLGVLNI